MFEVFNCIDGATIAILQGASRAADMVKRLGGGYDYDRAVAGFYVVGMSGRAVGKPYNNRDDAARSASMRNIGSDSDSFSVVVA